MNLKTIILLAAALMLAGCGVFSSEPTSPEEPKPEAGEAADSPAGAAPSGQNAGWSSAAPARNVPVSANATDRIVAVVNGEIITMRQLDNRVNALMKTRQAAGMNRDEVRRKVLDALIDQELMNQAAKAKGVFVTEADISQALESIKKDNNLTDERFRASLVHSGTTMEAFREDLRVEILRNRVMGSQMVSKIVVTDKEVIDALNGKGPNIRGIGASGGGGDTRPLRMIFLPMDPKNKGQALAEARRIKGEIEGGLSFADAAKKYSKGPGRDKGGDPGDGATVSNLPPQLQAALGSLKAGQPTEPLEAGNAVVILTVADDGRAPEPEEKKSQKGASDFSAEEKENARRQLEVYKMQQRYTEWAKELKRNATVRVNL